MASGIFVKFVSNIVLFYSRVSRSRGMLPGVCKTFDFSKRTYSRSIGTCNYLEQESKSNITNKGKNSKLTDRILRFLKVNPEAVIQKWKKELNSIPTTLKIGAGLYEIKPYKYTIKTASSFFRCRAGTAPITNIKLSAKGTRHQFNFPEKVPHILKLIKQDLLTIKSGGRSNKNKAGSDL